MVKFIDEVVVASSSISEGNPTANPYGICNQNYFLFLRKQEVNRCKDSSSGVSANAAFFPLYFLSSWLDIIRCPWSKKNARAFPLKPRG